MNNYIKRLLQGIGLLLVLLSSLVYAQTVNLNSHVATTGGPTASSDIYIRWYTVSNPTPQTTETAGTNNFVGESVSTASPLSAVDVTATTTPTNYYVFYYDKANNCLSTNYGKVTIVTNACPTKTVDLAGVTVTAAPDGSSLQWHTASSSFVQSGVGQTLVTNSAAVTPGTYYPVFYDSGNNCYSPVGTPVIVAETYCPRYSLGGDFGMGGTTCADGFVAYASISIEETVPANDATNLLKVEIDLPLAYIDETKTVTPKVMYGSTDVTSQFDFSTTVTSGKATFTMKAVHDEFATTFDGGYAKLVFSYTATADTPVDPATVSYNAYEGSHNLGSSSIPMVVQTVPCACYNAPSDITSNVPTKHGITLLRRAGADNGNWPMIRNSAHTVLESNTKGFVITRMTSDPAETAAANHISKIANPSEGMMVYDTFSKCLKIYSDGAWTCFSTPSCP